MKGAQLEASVLGPRAAPIGQDLKACLAHGLRGPEAVFKSGLVERLHPCPRRLILHWPKGDDERSHSGIRECPSEPKNPLSPLSSRRPRVARGEHRPLDTVEIKRSDFFRRQRAVVIRRRVPAPVGSGEDESSREEWALGWA